MNKPFGKVVLAFGLGAVLVLAGIRFFSKGSTRAVVGEAQPETASEAVPIATTPRTQRAGLSSLERKLQALSADPVERKPQIDKLVEEMSAAERIAALEQLWNEDSTGAQRELTSELLRTWAHESPQAVANWLADKPSGTLQRESSHSVAVIWANQNLPAATAWVRNWPGEEKESGMTAIAYEAVRTSPKEAIWLASELAPTPARDELITHAVREWAMQDPEGPVSWAEKMENPKLREQVFASTAISLSETDPVAAANLALEKLQTSGRQEDTVVSIVQRWAQSEPRAAADWVTQFPEGRARDAAVENLIQIWAEKTPEKPAEWLSNLPEGGLRDAGMAAYAHKLATRQPQSALEWAKKITDPDLRAREVESLAHMVAIRP